LSKVEKYYACTVTYIAEHVARRVAEENKIHVLVAPTIPYGEAFGSLPLEKQLPGTITLSGSGVCFNPGML
jgi:creatinine amidohydrolase/Fe(II)-dependent formamide hydrolase-like protein